MYIYKAKTTNHKINDTQTGKAELCLCNFNVLQLYLKSVALMTFINKILDLEKHCLAVK